MASVSIFVICFIGLSVTLVKSQADIVNMKTIEDGTPFQIICNTQRVILSAQANFSTIYSMQIDVWNNGAQGYKTVAQYFTFGLVTNGTQSPPDKSWKYNFTGSTPAANNVATMKIEILVPIAKCEDAGLYKCTLNYYNNAGSVVPAASEQNVSSTAATTEPFVSLSPIFNVPSGITNTSIYEIGENITVTCKFEGPQNLTIKWKRERRPAIGIDIQYDDYPVSNDITTDTPTRVPATSETCPSYNHQSVLKFTVSEEDRSRTYLCVVVSGEVEVSRSAVFIEVVSATQAPISQAASAGGKPDNIGMIVGIVVGCVVAIIIAIVIIVVVCRRRKSNGDNKNKDNTDRPDGGYNEPAPPPVLYSRPNKGVISNNNNNRDSKVPTGRINEGLNNSYDSRDSGHKGPPVYTITNQRQQNPGRQNQAFDPENNNADRQPPVADPRYYNYDPKPPGRRYSTDDNTDVQREYYEDANFGTGV